MTKGTSHGQRVFRVQAAFVALGGDILGPTEIAESTGLDTATVYRVLQAGLYDETFEQVSRGQYRLGAGSARLGMRIMARTPDPEAAHAVLEDLHNATAGLVGYYTAVGSRKLCVDFEIGDCDLDQFAFNPAELIAVNRCLRVGASGRAILAHQSPAILEKVLAERVPDGAGSGVIRDRSRLLRSLDEVRVAGYAVAHQEAIDGWDSIAAPVMWGRSIQGSVGVMLPSDPASDLDHLAAATVKAAARMTSLLSAK
ncbi:IclR family transcriptional regulator C-terminal domain-containing protein [Streptomyces luteireticuli]|uniref:IclR family transcriptional regulator domain-containing protein n=1 Tax=Streptomyces luteireticuli TaxID=173858 RepID=UPI003556084E